MIELHFSVVGYGGLHIPFSGITQYLRGLVSMYERLIIAGVRILIVSSMSCVEAFATRIKIESSDQSPFLEGWSRMSQSC